MVIRLHNQDSLRIQRALTQSSAEKASAITRLGSGLRINCAADDPAGLAMATALNASARVHGQAIRNINDGLSAIAVTDAALATLSEITTRMIELAEQASNGSYSQSQRAALDKEASALRNEFNRVIDSTSFNGVKLLDGTTPPMAIQAGINSSPLSRVTLPEGYAAMSTSGTGVLDYIGGYNVGTRVTQMASGDFNSDGKNDVVAISDNGASKLMLGNGDGTFQAGISLTSSGMGVSVGDFNNDGDTDLVYRIAAGVTMYLGHGDGTFTRTTFSADNTVTSTFARDLNSDGKLDLLTATDGTNRYSVYFGNGDGTFGGAQNYFAASAFDSITFADVNNDGRRDVVTAHTSGVLNIAFGAADGTFTPGPSMANWTQPQTMSFGDANNDGKLDLLQLASNGGTPDIYLQLGNGDGTFGASQLITANFGLGTARLSDLNGDGSYDILATHNGSAYVFKGNGDGTFQTPAIYTSGSVVTGGTLVTDLNGDGVRDVVLSTYSDNTIESFLQETVTTHHMPDISLATRSDALSALDSLRSVLDQISASRGRFGAAHSRLVIALNLAQEMRDHTTAAAARITDADMAEEAARLARSTILENAAASILASVNMNSALVLELLRA